MKRKRRLALNSSHANIHSYPTNWSQCTMYMSFSLSSFLSVCGWLWTERENSVYECMCVSLPLQRRREEKEEEKNKKKRKVREREREGEGIDTWPLKFSLLQLETSCVCLCVSLSAKVKSNPHIRPPKGRRKLLWAKGQMKGKKEKKLRERRREREREKSCFRLPTFVIAPLEIHLKWTGYWTTSHSSFRLFSHSCNFAYLHLFLSLSLSLSFFLSRRYSITPTISYALRPCFILACSSRSCSCNAKCSIQCTSSPSSSSCPSISSWTPFIGSTAAATPPVNK